MMNEREALLKAICDNPDDDTPRLVFADWLDENDEPERAEFIRLQIEIARLPDGKKKQKQQAREKELLDAHRAAWEQPFRQFEVAGSFREFVYGVHFRRGFVWGIDINDEEQRFANHVAELFAFAPIQRVAFFHKEQHADLARCPELLQVKELSIDRAGFETEELEELFRLKVLVNINRLELIADDDNGHLAPEGIELLSRTTALPELRHLDLSHNWCDWMGDDGWVATLTKGKFIAQLESLSLRGTLIGDEAAQTLARCKRFHTLGHLDLSCNYVGDEGARAIATTKNLPNLTTLDLRQNISLDLRQNISDADQLCSAETRRLLKTRLGKGVLIDGRVDE